MEKNTSVNSLRCSGKNHCNNGCRCDLLHESHTLPCSTRADAASRTPLRCVQCHWHCVVRAAFRLRRWAPVLSKAHRGKKSRWARLPIHSEWFQVHPSTQYTMDGEAPEGERINITFVTVHVYRKEGCLLVYNKTHVLPIKQRCYRTVWAPGCKTVALYILWDFRKRHQLASISVGIHLQWKDIFCKCRHSNMRFQVTFGLKSFGIGEICT